MTEPTVELLAATFRRMRQVDPDEIAQHWREAAAKSFADVAMALEAGLSPTEVAAVCFAAAEAFAEPERTEEVRDRCARRLGAVVGGETPSHLSADALRLARAEGWDACRDWILLWHHLPDAEKHALHRALGSGSDYFSETDSQKSEGP